ncbi:PREDICTED: uncharacterized protein LOC104713436 [Camelina sativa]|uniref:Uncharacterized protein LOC104713436 n=1 Tax=Camelina sativa TaxID=90675 RepID=A0ABM0TNA4_CAMSA|nr:PREDICTED: uncharacterized protein LOC104713436 [Camelina sativa]
MKPHGSMKLIKQCMERFEALLIRSLSSIHAMNHQCVSFLAGKRRGMDELEYEPEETSIPIPVQEFHQTQQFAPPNVNTSVAHGPSSHIAQHYDCNKEKVLVPPNGLSSPVRRTFQEFNLCEAKSGNQNPNSTGEELSY